MGGGDLVLIALGGEGHIVNARGDGLGVEVVLDVRDLDLLAVFEGPRRRAGPGLKVGVERDALLNVLDLFEEVHRVNFFLIDLALDAVLRYDEHLDGDRRIVRGGKGHGVVAGLGIDVVFDGLDGDGLLGLGVPRLGRGEGDDLGVVELFDVLHVQKEGVRTDLLALFLVVDRAILRDLHLHGDGRTDARFDHGFIVHALEKLRLDRALEHTLGTRDNVEVLGADDDVDLFVLIVATGTAGVLLVLEHDEVVLKHDAVDDVRLADELGDEFVDGGAVDFGRRTDLLNFTRIHDDDLVGHRQRLFLIVRDEDERDADLLLDVFELLLHLLAEL